MDANTYQQEAKRTLIDAPDREIPQGEIQMIWTALLVAISAGQLVEYLKKAIFHQHGVDYQVFADYLYRVALMATMQNGLPVPKLSGEEVMKLWVTTGLVGEAAEIAEMVTSSLLFHEPLPAKEFSKELGDLVWYWAGEATQSKLALNDILIGNVEKLQKRYQNGYSAEASKNREQ
jgi:NTP pyrophosphatase (non-canonical NTP hydrolase)